MKAVKAAFALFLCALLLSGCAGAGPAVQTGGAELVPEPTASPSLSPDTGGELFIPIPKSPTTLNPLKVFNQELANIFTLIYEPFVKIGVDGKPSPSLAQTWSVSGDGKIWTFKMREKVRWHDGSDFTASDVEYTLSQIQNMAEGDSPWSGLKNIISSFSVQDERTLTITTMEPGMAVLYALNFPVIKKDSAGAIDKAKPMGTGPYIVNSYDNGEMSLAIYDGWWRRLPYISSIRAIPMDSHDDELPAFQSGILDYVATPLLTASQYKQYGATSVTDYMTQYYDCLVTNNAGAMSELKLRQAVAYAIDKGDIISKALMFHAVACDVMIPPDSWLYDGKYKLYEFNTPKAQALLFELGYSDSNGDGLLEKNGAPLTLELLILQTDDTLYLKDVGYYLSKQLASVGITLNVVEKSWDDYNAALSSRDFDMALVSFYTDRNPDPSYLVGSDGPSNFGGYSSARMDEVLSRCKAAYEEADVKAAYNEFSQTFIDELPHIPLYYRTNSIVYDSSLKGVGVVREDALFNNISDWYLLVKKSG